MKNLVMIARPTADGLERVEVGNWLVEVVVTTLTDPAVSPLVLDTLHVPIQHFPTSVARNRLVELAQKKGVDLLFMVDNDCGPPTGFFRQAFLFLVNHNGPAVLGCPYVSGDERVQVMDYESITNDEQRTFRLTQISRLDAARRTGIQKVGNIGTHLVAYRMGCFDRLKKPYFSYTYNEDETKVLDTEDVKCHRSMWEAGIPIYCDFDHWAYHFKVRRHDKPYLLTEAEIGEAYREQAASLINKPEATT